MGTAPVQGELWGRHAHTWSIEVEPQMAPMYDAAIADLAPLQGLDLLDAGCGAGFAASKAATAGATVSGLDASPGLLEVASARLPGADLRVGDIDTLPWDDRSFDVVTAYNSVQYATEPQQAVEELARVCRPGGRVLIGVWGAAERCETEGLFSRLRSLAPPPPGTPAPLGVSEPGVVEDLLEKAGLTVVGGGEASCAFRFRDLDHAWTSHTSAGPLQKVIELAGADAVRRVMDEVLEADRKPDGELRQDNVFRHVVARKD
jgi:SAM-dependent methyltransferase